MTTKQYYQEHREEIRAKAKQHYKTHQTEILAKHRQYYETHRQQEIDKTKRYIASHKPKVDAQRKRYRQQHQQELNAKAKQYARDHPTQVHETQKKYYQTHKPQQRRLNNKAVKKYRINHIKQLDHYLGIRQCPICFKKAQANMQARLYLNTRTISNYHVTFRHYITYKPTKCEYHYIYAETALQWLNNNQIENPFS